MASQSLGLEQNLEGLFNCPYFYGELSREDAIQILNEAPEAVANDGEPLTKRILYLETNPWAEDIGKNRFAIMEANFGRRVLRCRGSAPDYDVMDIQPTFYFSEITTEDWNFLVDVVESGQYDYIERKNPFSLQVLATVKAASCNLETPEELPTRIKKEVEKYQDLNERIKSNFYCDSD